MPVFTTAAATLRARRASRNPSLASPLTTSTTTTDTANLAPATDQAPTSPLPESESIVLKARRAYDRDRQRAKKRKDRADRERERERERERSSHSTSSDSPPQDAHPHPRRAHGGGGGRAGAKPKLISDASDDRDAFPGSPGVEEIIADIVQREAQARGVSEPVQVHLEQLVKPGRARKSKAGEFELVPGMPVVIALDDHMPDEAELDEPWEHISADELDEKRVEPPSYATVLANAL
ncbi:hypothetical protein L227DRAFT_560544 [Lentinus tigrinus ALCF2SS1-6]|uniref:Uncharacterized protein n=1 Tax=Lentinus tigrinus ALCF2SS1-6 TaxID=1328759 RepID=A0A5C2SM73_9APHY|nr:hypothetical protein L227DRAFT_560544 [Lentinus tigrinus ALCF2SS1-6]